MPLAADLLARRTSHFLLWRPNESVTPPLLVLGRFQPGNPPTLTDERQFTMKPAAGVSGLWQIAAADCGLADGDIIHYWFEVEDTHPHWSLSRTVRCTDPAAHTVDWRLTADSWNQPAAVVRFSGGRLTVCDRRVKLAFACLLTAVGVPMILAGEEFADQHDRFDSQGHVTQDGGKQVDPVDFSRLGDDWRRRIFEYVARLVKARTEIPALSVDDTTFIHTDFNDGKRVLVWRRGNDTQTPAVVIANFSDFVSDGGLAGEYRVPNWPATPPGKRWREITQDRLVAHEFVGREPLFSWEAKVYTLV